LNEDLLVENKRYDLQITEQIYELSTPTLTDNVISMAKLASAASTPTKGTFVRA